MNIQDEVTYWAYATGWRIVGLCPKTGVRSVRPIRRWRGGGGHGVWPTGEEPAKVLPDATDAPRSEVLMKGMRSYLRYWCDALPLCRRGVLRRSPIGTGRSTPTIFLRTLWAAGHGAVFAVPHAGNYDLTGAWASIHFAQVIQRCRAAAAGAAVRGVPGLPAPGMKILPHAGRRGVFDQLVDLVRDNGLRASGRPDLSRNGVQVEFFGEPAKMPIGPAAISLLTGAPMLATALYYQGPRAHVHVFAPVEKSGR